MRNIKLDWFVGILLAISGVTWFATIAWAGMDPSHFIEFMKPISTVLSVDMLFILAFIKWGWRWPYLQGWLVPYPDLNGTWIGTIQTNWKDPHTGVSPGPIATMLTIQQTFGHISCVMRTKEMVSYSFEEGFRIDPERQRKQLTYSYTSKPNVNLRDRSTPHDGTATLNIIATPRARKLEGEYWTQRGTAGTLSLTFASKTIQEGLPEGMPAHPMED